MSSLDAWIADLRRAAVEIEEQGEQVVSKGALNIKTDWKEHWDGYAHLPHLPRAINYDVQRDGGTVEASIGPVRGELQAGLAPYIEYGTVNNPPLPGMEPAVDEEEPRFERAVADLGEKLLAER